MLACLDVLLARGRRTVTNRIRAAGLSGQFRPCYPIIAAAAKRAHEIDGRLVLAASRPLVTDRSGRSAPSLLSAE